MGHIVADTQAHQFWQMNYWASRVSTGPQFTYTGFWNGAFWGRHTSTPVLADELSGFKRKHSTTIYVYWISGWGTLGKTHMQTTI